MNEELFPTRAEFIAGPLAEVQKVAPTTMIYAPGGTRRSAVFAGIEPWSEQYMRWARQSTFDAFELIFRQGIRHIITTAISPGNTQESNRYSEKLYAMADWILAGEESLTQYSQNGWRARILGGGHIPELRATAQRLCEQTNPQAKRTIWWTVEPNHDAFWQHLLTAAATNRLRTREDAVRALYGEVIPPATLYLAFGKPTVSTAIVPPLLCDNLQCYWSQQVGYSLTEHQLRTILYDYAYLRRTWRTDKLDRAYAGIAHQEAWETGPILGLGMQLGPFWYPAPMHSSAWAG
ncbi:MAG: hypothetical protein H6641_17010 [Caldilineaceae bacterium]|nr:hypothetical protein [Caldilineaceae bacterium]